MTILKIAIPIIYSFFIASSYGMVLNQKFGRSLMQSYCVQILLLLVCGMLFGNLLVGIAAGIILALIGWIFCLKRDQGTFRNHLCSFFRDFSAITFLVLACAVFVMNYGKHYSQWDEFSHWGRFIEESCRLNQLYVMSTAEMAHKDYVPGVTLFEYLWCKLSLSYSEANAYRGIQMLFVAVVLATADQISVQKSRIYNKTKYFLSVLILMGIPLLFNSFYFYHSIYEDAIFGILMFYSICIASCIEENEKYCSVSLTLALAVLIMSKMTAVPYVLIIWLLYALSVWKIRGGILSGRKVWDVLPLIFSLLLWMTYTRYTGIYVESTGTQSYAGFTPALILGVIAHNGQIPWQNAVEKSYLKAIFTQGLVGAAPFAFVSIAVLVVLHLQIKGRQWDGQQLEYKSARLLLFWLTGSTIIYALMMCVLYDTAFTEYEARKLASYDRYMSTWLIVLILMLVTWTLSNVQWRNISTYLVFLAFIVIVGNREQLLSGIRSNEAGQYSGESKLINAVVADDESVLLVERGTNGKMAAKLGYYCIPRVIGYTSPGPSARQDDIWSVDMSTEELRSLIETYDYVYVIKVDEPFVERYHELLPDITENTEEVLYKVDRKNGELDPMFDR